MPFVYFSVLVGAAVFCMGQAKADTVAEQVFGKWQRITPAQIFVKVPEWERDKTASIGSVTNEYRKSGSPAGGTPKQVPLVNSTSR